MCQTPHLLGTFLLSITLVVLASPALAEVGSYDPLAIEEGNPGRTLDMTVTDPQRDRAIPILVYLPSEDSPCPVLLFSHGLGGSRKGCAYLGRHWAARGYASVFLQHPGSDESVWRDVPRRERMDAMREAASGRNFVLRVRDVPAVLDQLERWNATGDHPLAGRLDPTRVGMSGHSFGAVTTQAVSGQSTPRGRKLFTDARIRAAIALSPSSPRRGSPEEAFARVEVPWMLMTGTHDVALIGDADVASRLAVFGALPEGGKYELVLDGAEHSAFTERALPGDNQPRNPNHHRAILALSTAFWDAWLREDPDAKAWLDGDGPRSILEEADRWRTK